MGLLLFCRIQKAKSHSIPDWIFICSISYIYDMLNQKFSSYSVHPSHNSCCGHLWRNPLHNSYFLWTIYQWNCRWVQLINGLPFWLGIAVPVHHTLNTHWSTRKCERFIGRGQRLVEACSSDHFIINLWGCTDNGRDRLLY